MNFITKDSQEFLYFAPVLTVRPDGERIWEFQKTGVAFNGNLQAFDSFLHKKRKHTQNYYLVLTKKNDFKVPGKVVNKKEEFLIIDCVIWKSYCAVYCERLNK